MQRKFTNLTPLIAVVAAIAVLTTIGCKKEGSPSVYLPVLTTNVPTDITAVSATLGGTVTSEGGEHTWIRGIDWGFSPDFSDSSFGYYNGASGTGTFSFPEFDLIPHTKYYVRAFAQNSAGTAYGNVVSFSTPALIIGGSVANGIVFDIDTTGRHGLVCASADQGMVSWSNGNYVYTGAVYSESGYDNSDLIVNVQGDGTYAAHVCFFLPPVVFYGVSYNHYAWYLPSKDELNKLYNQKNAIGGFSDGDYWSSTEFDTTKAWLKNFSDGKETASDKSVAHYVRAILSF